MAQFEAGREALKNPGCQQNLMLGPNSMAVDSNGGVFVADTLNYRVVRCGFASMRNY